MKQEWQEILNNDGFPSETQNVVILWNEMTINARFLAPFCVFCSLEMPTMIFKGVTHWKPCDEE